MTESGHRRSEPKKNTSATPAPAPLISSVQAVLLRASGAPMSSRLSGRASARRVDTGQSKFERGDEFWSWLRSLLGARSDYKLAEEAAS